MDPFAIQFPDGWPMEGLRWYGLSYLAGFAVGWWIIIWMARTGRTPIKPDDVADIMIYLLVGVLAGGRIGYILFYDPKLFIDFSTSFPYWGLLAINKGGMASHGGMIGVIAALWVYAVRHRISKLHMFDVAALGCIPGLFMGRIANFVNGELPGRKLPADLQANPPWWSVKYPADINTWSPPELLQLGDAVKAVNVSPDEWTDAVTRYGLDADATQFVASTLDKIVVAVQQGNEQVGAILRPMLEAYYPSQLLQALTDGPLLILVMVIAWWGPRKPGVVGAAFLGAYGVMRMASERFREPDLGVALLPTPLGDLSRGQVLSILMILVAVIGGPIVARRPVDRMGGLVRHDS